MANHGIKAAFGNNTIFNPDKNKLAFSSEFNHPKIYQIGRINGTSQTMNHPYGYPLRTTGYLLRASKHFLYFDKKPVFTNYGFELIDPGPKQPSTTSIDPTGTITWTTPNNVFLSDNNYAVASFSGAADSHWLHIYSFGFGIPSNVTITGIVVQREGLYTGDLAGTSQVQLIKDPGPRVGSAKTGNFGTTDAYVSFGSSTDLWGTTWTPAEINANGFGAAIQTSITSGSGDIKCDHLIITIYYSGGFARIRTDNQNIYLTSDTSNELVYVSYIDPAISIPTSRDISKGNIGLKFSNQGTLTAKDFQQKLTTEYNYLKVVQEGDVTVTADAISGPPFAQRTNTVDIKNPLGYAAHIIVFDEIGRNSFSYFPKATGVTVSFIAAETEIYITPAIIRFRVSREYINLDGSSVSSGATNYRFHYFLTDLRLPN